MLQLNRVFQKQNQRKALAITVSKAGGSSPAPSSRGYGAWVFLLAAAMVSVVAGNVEFKHHNSP